MPTDEACYRLKLSPRLEAEFEQHPDKWSVHVLVDTIDGKQHQQFIDFPKGDSENPVSYEELEDKFQALVSGVYSREHTNRLLGIVKDLERVKIQQSCLPF